MTSQFDMLAQIAMRLDAARVQIWKAAWLALDEQRKAAAMQDRAVTMESGRPQKTVDGIESMPASAAAPHPETPNCGYDRNGSVSAGHYVCLCGWEDASAVPEPAGAMPEGPPSSYESGDGSRRIWEGQWMQYARVCRAHAEQLQERVKELKEESQDRLKLAHTWWKQFEKAEARLREALAAVKHINADGVFTEQWRRIHAPIIALTAQGTRRGQSQIQRDFIKAGLDWQGEEEKP